MLKNNLPPAPNPNTKGGGTPKPATEKPFRSPSTTRNIQLMLRCLHVKTGQKGDLHQHLAVRYKSRKSCCYLPPTLLTSARTKLLACVLQCQRDLCQEKSSSPVCNKAGDNAGNVHRNTPSCEHFPHGASWGVFSLVSCSEQ